MAAGQYSRDEKDVEAGADDSALPHSFVGGELKSVGCQGTGTRPNS